MEKLDAFKTALRGKKTYLAVAIGALYMAGVWAGAWEWDEKVLYAVGLGGLAFLRAALGGGNKPNQTNGTNSLNALMPALLLVGALGLTGCSSVAPGNDAVAVRAQQTIEGTYNLATAFLSWEESNRAIVPEDVQAFAETLREEFPPANRSARKLLKVYKANRTAENKANLATALLTLEALRVEVSKYFTPPPQARVTDRARGAVMAAAVSPVVVMAAIDGLIKLISLISAWIATAKRNKEWTPEEEAEIESKMEEAFTSASYWQPRVKPANAKK